MPNVNTQYKGAFAEGKDALSKFWESIINRSNYEQSPQYKKEVEEYTKAAQEEADKRNAQQQNIQQQRVQQQMQHGAKPSIQPPPAPSPSQSNQQAVPKQDIALAKLEGTGNVPVQLPPNGLPIGQEVTQLFNTVTRCWNPNAMEGDASPWLPGKEEVGQNALNWLRRIWTQAYNKRGSDPRALTGFYYILSILLNNTPPWMDPANLPYYKAQLDAQNIGGIPGLANRIKEMEQTNMEALGRQETGTTPPTYSTNANNAFTLPN